MLQRLWIWAFILLTALPFLFSFQIYTNYRNPNEVSRLLLTSAMVDDHSFIIDQAIQRYGTCQDISSYQGHYYSNKAIGYSVLSIPLYFMLHTIANVSDRDALLYLLRICLNLIPLFLFCSIFIRWLHTKFQLGSLRFLVIASLLFGTLAFPYEQLYASHLLTGLCLLAGILWMVHSERSTITIAAGAILGFAFLLEIPSVLIFPLCLIWLFAYQRKSLIPFTVGWLVTALPAFAYNYAAFGGFLHWSYQYVATPELQAVHHQGYVGTHLPSTDVLWKLLFGTNRGFFYFMPHLIFGVIGFLITWKENRESLLILSFFAITVLFYSGYSSWDGGWSFGPRFLTALVPMLIYGTALWLRSAPNQKLLFCYLILLGFSISWMAMGAVTTLLSPRFLGFVLQWEVPAMFWNGMWTINWCDALGLSAVAMQCIFIALITIPVLLLLRLARLRTTQIAAVILPLFLYLGTTAMLQPWMISHMPAEHCLAIGRIAFLQGRYAPAVQFLEFARTRATNPALKAEASNWLYYAQKK